MTVDPLTPGEHELFRASRTGTVADLSALDNRVVRAAFIEALLTEPAEPPGTTLRGVRLAHATVEGRLDLSGLRVECPVAIENCTFTESPVLLDARLLSLSLRESTLPGLNAESLHVQGSLRMEGATVASELTLLGARIGGSLYLRRVTLTSDSGQEYALNGSRLEVGGHLSVTDSTITGQVRLISATVGGVVNLRGTQLNRPGKLCLQAERMDTGEGLWFGPRFVARGRILLSHCDIRGGLDLAGSTLVEPEVMDEPEELEGKPISFRAVRVKVARNLLFTKGFSAEGGIVVTDATVEGQLSFRDAGDCGRNETIDLSGTSASEINLLFRAAPSGALDLSAARTALLVDDPRTWPAVIEVDGFAYGRMRPAVDVSVRQRLSWLRRTRHGYSPQPYEQLITAYRADGQEQEARRVAMAHQRARRHKLNWAGRLWGGLLLFTVGYGYRTWLAAIWLSALAAVGSFAFSRGTPERRSKDPAAFNPVVYTVDMLLPIGDFGQEGSWQFTGHLQWLSWSYVVFGWLLTSAVVAGLARVINR